MQLITLLTNYCLDLYIKLYQLSYTIEEERHWLQRIPNIAHQGIDHMGKVMLIDGCNTTHPNYSWGSLVDSIISVHSIYRRED